MCLVSGFTRKRKERRRAGEVRKNKKLKINPKIILLVIIALLTFSLFLSPTF